MRGALRSCLCCSFVILFTAIGALAATKTAVPDYSLRLKTGSFDPLARMRAQATAPPVASTEPAYAIVQFRRSLTRDERTAVQRKYGLRLTDYIPNFAYLERVDGATLRSLAQDPLYRAHVPYSAAFKISPDIGKRRFTTEKRQAMTGVWLRFVLFPEADPGRIVAALKEAGASSIKLLDDRQYGGSASVQAVFPGMAIARTLAQRPEIRWIEEVPEVNEDNGVTAPMLQSGTSGLAAATPIWNAGIHGEGQIVDVIDTVIDMNHCMFMDNSDNTVRPAHRKMVGFRNPNGDAVGYHGTFVAGIVAGDDANNPGTGVNRGNAWGARLTHTDRGEIDAGNITILNALSSGKADGAAIHTNSWHIDTLGYTQISNDVDTFVWNNEESLVLGSSGNVGESIGPPGTAKNAICVSAAAKAPNQDNFGDGTTGPTSDNRRKPELFTPGCQINSATVSTPCTVAQRPSCATSWATPAAAAAAALTRQYYMEGWYPTGTREAHNGFIPTGALLKATLLNSTRDMTGMPGYPGTMEGWGLVQLDNVLTLPGSARRSRVWDTPNGSGFLGGDPARSHIVNVATNGQPLRVTLVWSDPPANAGAANSQINDLNLTVTSPGGAQTFLGNVFAAGVSTPGGLPDNTNNVEMVVVNTPAPGNWTITVTPATVNVGPQGYALIATADMPAPPATTGNQNTLVVRAHFLGTAGDPSLPNLQNKMINVADYINKVSYGQTTILPEYRGPIALDHDKAYYYDPSRSLLIEMTTELVGKLVAADPNVFTKGTADPNDDIDRIIIVTNDEDFTADWATTGPWPYELPGGFTRPLSVSIQAGENSEARFTHGLGHQFNLVDLYAHPGVTFGRPAYADEWDDMAKPFHNAHFLAWSKERAKWLSTHGDERRFIPRPAAGVTTHDGPIHLFDQESATVNRKVIAVGLTPGAAAVDTEHTAYYIEARNKTADTYEGSIPNDGVLIYLVNDLISQGQGPVILRDKNPADDTIQPFAAGDDVTIPGTGITIKVRNGTAGAPYDITVDYAAPADTYNLRITRGDTAVDGNVYAWFSPDIWNDSPKDGADNLAAAPPPVDHIENPVAGMDNKIRVRLFNDGPAIATNFDLRLRVSDPYHTVGNQADFNTMVGIQHVDGLVPSGQPIPPGMFASGHVFTFVWHPAAGAEHACALADVINPSGTDTNLYDNDAQENFDKVTSVTGSPFHPVDFHFTMKNPYAEKALFYFKVEGAPSNWSTVVTPAKILLNPGERIEGTATITPPPDEKLCSSRVLQVVSWTPRGDTLIRVGGTVVQVDMRRPEKLTLSVTEENCKRSDPAVSAVTTAGARCRRIVVRGCTNPPLANQLIWVKYISSDGEAVWHQVMTDAAGCYEDFLVTTGGATWSVTTGFDGTDCEGPTSTGPKPSGGEGPNGLFPPLFGTDLWYSFHLGHNFALGALRRQYRSGPSLTFDLERPFRERFALYAMLGYHYFDAKAAPIDDLSLWNLSLNLRAYVPAGAWRGYFQIGPGLYRLSSGSTKAGANLGAGLELAIGPKLALEAGGDLHAFNPGSETFLDLKLGVKWHF
ncbi:MAG: peptidase and subtilisin kexin sedolisin [Acidobacteria bacterium]|nr:peptidase and subtilisin kexin sedolisin [Acidobacteriota bacterium]